MEIFIILGILGALALIWLNILASIAVNYDHTLEPFQKKAQIIFIWLIPYIGASFILFMVFEHSPEAIPKNWIPWPFNKLIFGKPIPQNKNGDDYGSIDTPGITNHHSSSGGDIGGGGD